VEQESSGGRGQLGGTEQAVRTVATVRQADELNRLPIALSDGRRINLDQVATVRDTFAERSQIALLDGKPVVGFKLYRAKGFDETRIAAGVAQALGRLQAADPSCPSPRFPARWTTPEQFQGSMTCSTRRPAAVLVVWWFLPIGAPR